MDYWTTRSGEKIPIKDLSDTHLMNILRMLYYQAADIRAVWMWDVYVDAGSLQGDMAQYYSERDIEHVEHLTDEEWLCEYYPLYASLKLEAKKRFGSIKIPKTEKLLGKLLWEAD